MRSWWPETAKKIETNASPWSHHILALIAILALKGFLELFFSAPFLPFKLLPANDTLSIAQNAAFTMWVAHRFLGWITAIAAAIITTSAIGQYRIFPVSRFFLATSFLVLIPGFGLFILIIAYLWAKATPIKRAIPILVANAAIAASIANLDLGVRAMLTIMASGTQAFSTPIILTRLLCLTICLEAIIFALLAGPKEFKAFFKSYSWQPLATTGLMFVLGITLARHHIILYIEQNLLSFLLSLAAIAGTWLIYNLPEQTAAPARNTIFVVAGLSALTAVLINFPCLYILVTALALTAVCRLTPWAIGRIGVIKAIISAAMAYLGLLTGCHFGGSNILRAPAIFHIYFIILPGLFLNFTALSQDGEKQNITALLGEMPAKVFCAITLFTAFVLAPFVFLDNRLFFIAIPAGAAGVFLCLKRKAQTTQIFYLLIASLIVLILWLSWA